MIDEVTIHTLLTKTMRSKHIDCVVLPEVDSTNQWLMARPYDGKAQVCVTDNQTEGRGRRGRDWQSKPGASLCLSYLNRLKLKRHDISGFSLAVAIYCREALQPFINDTIQLKWPNDLLLNGRKVAGILLETQHLADDYVDLVVGVGVNLTDVYPDATSLESGQPVISLDVNDIAVHLITAIQQLFNEFAAVGFRTYKSRWLEHDAWLYEAVQLQAGEKEIAGLHQGITDKGELILNVNGIDQFYAAGEVSLRHATSR